ncbi:rhomboid family intramembrane serine protease [Mucilaginibacter sp. HC2]|uniref:rhomboid family intramembrane serine protease n=1 Tax=Mucilaginibacter inviolabilis TaxID=2714892 RepID=UPI00140B299C|nr:rhomboid family intramembrane serine protease [Mucilaginibacter inviolabilis]NHA06626.1 rhomboid family intramembrane serine protease [Mucilaginibacter inviolabilis]
MTNFLTKLKLIYLPYLIISLLVISIYSFLNWLLIMYWQLISPNEELVNFWLPMAISILAVAIWLRPRVKLLSLKTQRNNLPFLYYFVAALAILAPTIIAQEYLITATGKLTSLQTIEQIDRHHLTKYYRLKKHFIDKKRSAFYIRSEVTGRNSEHIVFYIDIVSPILDSAGKYNSPVAWLGTEYSKSVSSSMSNTEKHEAYTAFAKDTEKEFNSKDLDLFDYLDHIGNSDTHRGFINALKTSSAYSGDADRQVILIAQKGVFENRNGDKLQWIFYSFGIGAGIWLILIAIPKLNRAGLKKYTPRTWQADAMAFFKPFAGMKWRDTGITGILIGVNVLIFTIMVFAGLGVISFDTADLYKWGANYGPAVKNGEWWRLITCMFLHGGVMHLLMNMFGLLLVAAFLRSLLDNLKLGITYFICGLLASLASIWWNPTIVSIGASGAIFGLYGVAIALLTTNKSGTGNKKGILLSFLFFVGVNLLFGLIGNTDNAAHIGGLVSGLIMGYVLYFFIEAPKPPRKKRIKIKQETITPDTGQTAEPA